MTLTFWLARIAPLFRHWIDRPRRDRISRRRVRVLRPLEQLEERAVPATFHVALSGSDTTGDGSLGNPFRSVQKGIDTAAAQSDGDDIVKVEAGTYSTPTVDLALTIPNSANLQNLQLLGGFDVGQGFGTRTPRSTI